MIWLSFKWARISSILPRPAPSTVPPSVPEVSGATRNQLQIGTSCRMFARQASTVNADVSCDSLTVPARCLAASSCAIGLFAFGNFGQAELSAIGSDFNQL